MCNRKQTDAISKIIRAFSNITNITLQESRAALYISPYLIKKVARFMFMLITLMTMFDSSCREATYRYFPCHLLYAFLNVNSYNQYNIYKIITTFSDITDAQQKSMAALCISPYRPTTWSYNVLLLNVLSCPTC